MNKSEKAKQKIKEIYAIRNKRIAVLRVDIKNQGCLGLKYSIKLSEPEDGDEIINTDSGPVHINSKKIIYVIGSKLDYVDNGVSSKFIFLNPNESGKCGCGESFSL